MSWLQMDISAALMIIIVMIVRAFARQRLPRIAFIWLWGIIWLRLCIPFSLPSQWNLYSLLNTAAGSINGPAGTSAAIGGTVHHYTTPLWEAVLSGGSTAGTGVIPPSVALPYSAPAMSVWTSIWLTGVLGCAALLTFAYLRWYLRFRSALPVSSEFVEGWLTRHRLRRTIRIRQTPHIDSPLTYGIVTPVILLPLTTDWSDHRRLEYILTHEYVHIRRFDSAAKMLVLLALCLHWYNPLVWVMCILVNRDIELICDEAVVRRIGHKQRAEYAYTLIHMEEQKLALPSPTNHFSKLAIEERIESIMKFKKTTAAGLLSAFLLIGSLTTVLATSPASAAKSAAPVPASTAKPAKVYHAGETWKIKGEWEFTVNSIRETPLRANEADGYKPAQQVLIVDYSYKNLRPAGSEPLAFSKTNFYLNDAKNPDNTADGSHYTLIVPGEDRAINIESGKSVHNATWVYAFYDQKAATVQFNVGAYDSHLKLHETKFIVPVQSGK